MLHVKTCRQTKDAHALTLRAGHSWEGRAADGGSNEPCLREGCGELRLAKVHMGYAPKFVEPKRNCKTCPEGTECPKWHHDADERGRPKDAQTFYAVANADEDPEPAIPADSAIAVWDAYAAMVRDLLVRKSAYGNSWRKRGWNGNVTRVLTKADRLNEMLMRDKPWLGTGGDEDKEEFESVLDTLLDIGPLAAFAIANIEEGNRWGH
jgi:hypothetical protein